MNAKSIDASIENKSPPVRRSVRRDRIALKPKIPRNARQLFQYLADVRPRLLGLRQSFDAALQSKGVPNNIDAIQNALATLDDENGRLELPSPISRLDLLLIWGAPQAKWITGIVFKGLDIKFNPDDFKIPSKRFFNLYGVDCPDGFIKTYDLFAKIEKFLGKGVELGHISFSRYGLSSYLFGENNPPPNALILHKHGHHELNYVPYAAYGSDAVTYGLLYDYHRRKFFTTAYHGDGDVSPYDNPLEPFIRKFSEVGKYGKFERYVGCYDAIGDAELVNNLVVGDDFKYDEIIDLLKSHTIACFISSFLKENRTPKYAISENDRGRYKRFFWGKEREELQSQFPSSYLFCKTLPVTPIALDRFFGADYNAIDDLVEFSDCVAKLHGDVHQKNRFNGIFSDGYYQGLRKLFVKKTLPLMLECDDLKAYLIKTKKYKKKDRAILFALLDNAIGKIYSFAMNMIKNGAEGYGFVVAIIFWEHCEGGELSKMSSILLDSLSESICPSFIKKTAALHSTVRHNQYIPT